MINLAVAADLQVQFLREGVHAGNAHTVKASGDLIGAVLKFPSRMEFRHHHLGGGHFLSGMHVHGNPAAVVLHGDGIVDMDGHLDLIAETGQGLVNGVVHHLINKMMKARTCRGADVHGRPLSNRLQPLQDFDGRSIVFFRAAGARRFIGRLSHKRSPLGLGLPKPLLPLLEHLNPAWEGLSSLKGYFFWMSPKRLSSGKDSMFYGNSPGVFSFESPLWRTFFLPPLDRCPRAGS